MLVLIYVCSQYLAKDKDRRDRDRHRDHRDRDRDRDRGRRRRSRSRSRERRGDRRREDGDRRDGDKRDGDKRDGDKRNGDRRDGRNGESEKDDLIVDPRKQQEAIRSRYLGMLTLSTSCFDVSLLGATREKRKRGRRLHERKFVFDWDAGEDTSNDYNKLYQQRHEVQFFGRGSIAGVDINAQKKEKSEFYSSIMEQRRTEDEKKQEDARLDSIRKRQKQEEHDCRHWSQKSLLEMQERDWRIFREDYHITIKGGKVPKPLRSWEEAQLPSEFVDIIKLNRHQSKV